MQPTWTPARFYINLRVLMDWLADIFGHAYLGSGTPVAIVSHFLSAFTKGQVTAPPEACEPFVAKSYDIRKAYVACSFKGEKGSSIPTCK